MTGYKQDRFIDELQADMDEYIREAEMIAQRCKRYSEDRRN